VIVAKDRLITWLQDAHAMELMLPPILENHAKDAERTMPAATARVRQHAEETRRHADRMKSALQRLGSQPSASKSALSAIMGPVQSISTGIFSDELVKNALTDFATEEFEVACYNALIAAADELGEAEVAALCRENLL